MKLSKPIHLLKRRARLVARSENIALHLALDRVAAAEGFTSWSLLAARWTASPLAGELHRTSKPGDLVLIGARPGQGKTMVGLQLALESIKAGGAGAFFPLEWTAETARARTRSLASATTAFADALVIHDCDTIDANYIKTALATAAPGTTAVVDYLQLLDRCRDKPPLSAQMQALRAFARTKGIVLAFTAQISRFYDASAKPLPDIHDVRLSDPLDMSVFDTACFLQDGQGRFGAVRNMPSRQA